MRRMKDHEDAPVADVGRVIRQLLANPWSMLPLSGLALALAVLVMHLTAAFQWASGPEEASEPTWQEEPWPESAFYVAPTNMTFELERTDNKLVLHNSWFRLEGTLTSVEDHELVVHGEMDGQAVKGTLTPGGEGFFLRIEGIEELHLHRFH